MRPELSALITGILRSPRSGFRDMSTPADLLSLLWANLNAQAAADEYKAAGSPMGPDAGEQEARTARQVYVTKLRSYGVSDELLSRLPEFARTTNTREFYAAVDLIMRLGRNP